MRQIYNSHRSISSTPPYVAYKRSFRISGVFKLLAFTTLMWLFYVVLLSL